MSSTPSVPRLADASAADWARLASRRVFFGHQSVGGDILQGVAEVLASNPQLGLRVVESADPRAMSGPGLYHARIGENLVPDTKLAAFVQVAGAIDGAATAMVKYCYVDVTAETDAAALFTRYREAIETLRRGRPELTIVHVTLPLETDWGTYFHWKRVLRGQLTTHRELNSVRERYNALLRAAYAAGREPVFDLAQLEATASDGSLRTVRYRGQRVPVLAREWTHDGGHLNEAGRRRIAEAFLVTLARL